MTTTAKIAAKGCNNTGITEDLAASLHNQLGRKVLAVVELVAETRSEKRNGDESVVLSILNIEPAPEGLAEDHLRDLQRSFYYERQLADGQMQISPDGDGIEPKVSDVINANPGLRPHPYVTSQLAIDDSDAGPVCDVCGKIEAEAIHHMPSTNPFDVPVDDEGIEGGELEDGPDNPYDDVHGFEQGPDDLCVCGRPFEDEIHPDSDPDQPASNEPTAADRHLTAVD